MPLSISNSKVGGDRVTAVKRGPVSAGKGIVALLGGLVLIFLGLEISAPMILARLSHTEQRIGVEMKAAQKLQPAMADGRPTVLFVGNSLLLEGVQMDALHAELAQQYEIRRFAVEQTHYLDWYFGVRKLLQEGSRPSVIVLALATDQLASHWTMGEAFAHRQMSARDFPLVVRETNLDRTTASNYVFAHWSRWLADKGFIRQCVMILTVPKFRDLAARIADHGPHVNDPRELMEAAQARLPQLAELSREYGVRIVLLIPPTLHEDQSSEIQQIGAKAGVPVWVLSPPGEFPREYFMDGFHLNGRGSGIFTARLSQQLRTMQNIQANCKDCDRKAMPDSASGNRMIPAVQVEQGSH
jgi:hypothetical protein